MPSQPPDPYSRQFNFTNHAQTQPTTPLPGDKVDLELNEVRESVNATISRLNELQRDDGKLREEAVEGSAILQSAKAAAIADVNAAGATNVGLVNTAGATAQSAATAAQASATAAASSATAAAGSATQANTERLMAQASRNETYAKAAEVAAAETHVVSVANGVTAGAAAAGASASQAAASATAAAASATLAGTKANECEASAVTAQAAVVNAQAFATAAQGSATAADSEATAAAASATSAATSATSASTSASQSLTNKNAAAASASAASSSASAAAISAAAAEESAVDAEASAQAAENAASAAEASANGISFNSVRFDIAQTLNGAEKAQAGANLQLGSAAYEDLEVFAPVDHGHAIGDVTGLQSALDGKAATSHTHTSGQITDFNSAVDALVPGAVPSASTTVQGKVELATDAETLTGTSSTLAVTPISAGKTIRSYLVSYKTRFTDGAWPLTGSSGTGAIATNRVNYKDLRSPTSVVGSAFVGWELSHTRIGDASSAAIDWSKPFAIAFPITWAGALDDVNAITRVRVGESTSPTVPTQRCIGLEKRGSNAVNLVVHDGTNSTYVTSTSNPGVNVTVFYEIVSDGAGNVTLFANGNSVATTASGPKTQGSIGQQNIYALAENINALTGTQVRFVMGNPKVVFDY